MTETVEEYKVRFYSAAISTYALVILIVPLRIWCRITDGRLSAFGTDDMLIILSMLAASAFFFISIFGLGPSIGKHAADISMDEVVFFMKWMFAEQLLYTSSIAVIKYAILALYWRLFSTLSRLPILVGLFIVTGWALSLIFVTIFACDPIQAQWDFNLPRSHCTSLRLMYISSSTPNVIINLILLVLPIPYVWRLHAPVAQKLILTGVFMLGCFVSVVSVVRLIILATVMFQSADVTYNAKDAILWSVVEINVGLICACLPSMKPALGLLYLDRMFGMRTTTTGTAPSRSDPSTFQGTGADRSRTNKKSLSTGLFSSLAGLTRLDDLEKDGFEMLESGQSRRASNAPSLWAYGAGMDATEKELGDPIPRSPRFPPGSLMPPRSPRLPRSPIGIEPIGIALG